MHRAFHAIPPFKAKDGTPTNAVYGFISMIHKAVCDYQPSNVMVCFDTPAKTFRKKIFKKYQAHRPKVADDFKIQMPLVKKALDEAIIYHLEKPGYEADDIIGTVVSKVKETFKVLILTGDKDILQLVDKNVFVVSPIRGLSKIKLYTPEEVKKSFGVKPSQIVDFKALIGDQSDNYIGAKGIGPKTALSLIGEYQTAENLLDHLDEINKERIKKILKKHKKNVQMAKKLAIILNDVPIEFRVEKSQFKKFNENLKTFLQEFGMDSLIKRIFKKNEENKNLIQKLKKSKEKNKNLSKQPGLF